MISPDKAYNNLAIAITKQAIEDYKIAFQRKRKKRMADIEDFFKSKWGARITYNNGEYILRKTKEELGVEQNVRN